MTDESAEELFVDKEGIPHWDGENIALLREYRMRQMIEYSTQSSTTEAGREKRANLGLRLTRGLTGPAWKAVEPLLDDMAALTEDGSHQRIIEALDGLDKVAVVRKQQKFDDFFKRSRRRRGQEIVEYLRTFHNKYKELTELDTGTKLSDDLYAYFLLEGAMLTDDQKRLVTMVADNKYETKAFENTLKTNYHDLHLQEKTSRPPPPHPHGRPKGGGKGGKDKSKKQPRVYYTEADDVDNEEDEQDEDYDDEVYQAYEDGDAEEDFASDAGASQDEAINNAYAAYDTAGAKVRDLQRKRGFFKAEGTLTFEERKAEIAKDKQRTHCGACGKLGHWAGDPECPMGPKRPKPSAKPKSRADPRGRAAALSRQAWSSPSASGSSPRPTSSTSAKKRRDATLFVLDDVEYDSAFLVSSDRGSDLGSFKLVGSDVGDSASVVSDSLSTIPPTMKDDEVLPCPKCSKALVARQNHRTGGWFFGCSQFPDCKGTLNYNEGEQRLLPGEGSLEMVLMVSEDSDSSDVPVALIDTGCTRCMHGKRWRELFEKRCLHPRGLEIKMTDRLRSFSSAFGKRQEGRVVEIPVALGGRRGVIFSTEMEDCDTPLLVSLASQEALGAVLHLKEMRMELQTLAVDVQLLKVGGHLAVRLDGWGDDDHRSAVASSSGPATAISKNRDSEFFFAQAQKESAFEESDGEEIRVEEEVGHAFLSKDRGVLATDATGILSKTTRKKLESTWRELRREDRRLRGELLRPRFEAERFVTADFQTTVVFEPFGGEHILTRYGAREYGWMQSQPLDVDHSPDYDLLKGPGRALLYRILDLHWPYITVLAFPCHPWSLMTNTNKLIDWDKVRRSAVFVRGDQCAYGACDKDTDKPIKKPTGWLTNSAAVANHLSKRCVCPPGAHQQLLGRNSGGYRAQQAAAYPVGLAKAFCRGVLQQMQIDYRSSLVMDAAFPVEDAFPHERPRSRSPPRGEPVPEEVHQEGPPLGEDAPPAEAAAEAPEATAEVPVGPRRGRAPARRERGVPPGGRPLGFRRGRRTQHGEFELLTVELCAELDTFRSWHRSLLEKMGDDIETIIWGSDLFLEELGGVISEPLKMVKARRGGQRLQTAQPQLHAADAPLRMVTALKGDQLFRLDFEDWSQQSLQARRHWLPRHLLENDVVVFYFAGYERGDLPEGPAAAQQRDASRERMRRWELLPRAVKRAIERVHVNLGHPSRPALLRGLRLGKATALALKAARLFVCESCRRVQRPSIPRPSQLPRVDEFNVLLAMDCFENVDSAGNNWEFLGIMCMGTNFHVVCLLEDTHKNPMASEVRKFYELCWVSWAGQPEEAIMVDRARSFLGEFADYLEQEGVRLDSAALASPWHIGKMERHDGIWNSMLTRVVHDKQVAGLEEMRTAVTECNRAKNTLARRAGFSPYLWVLGRDVRLPASLADDAEVERVGEQVAAATPGSHFARKVEIRTQCRMAFIQTDTEDRLRRAELRQIRPTRGPFVVGQWVLFYDQAQPAKHRPEHPDNWRGLARVIGHEGRHGVWLAFRGLTVLASPEHLAAATGHEIHACGGSGFVDLRGRPKPPAAAGQEPAELGDESGMDVGPQAEVPEEPQPAPAPPEPEAPPAPPESEAPRAAPAAPEPPAAPAPAVGAEDVPVPPDLDFDAMEFDAAMQEIMRDDGDDGWHPDSHGVHTEPEPGTSRHRRPGSLLEEEETEERREREAKRRRLLDDVPVSIRQGTARSSPSAPADSATFVLDNDLDEFMEAGLETYRQDEAFFVQEGIGKEEFIFGLMRNEFEHAFLTKKLGRKEIKLGSLPDFDAAEPIPPDESEALRADKANIIIPMRWVDTDKNDGKYDEAGSRLVVVGFRDRLLGMFRRDAPTASRLAEALLLTLAAAMGMILSLRDVKNAYFNGQNLQREVYLEQSRGGLPGLVPGQLLRARKAIYGFAEAARLFWLALRDALLADGWLQSCLVALFYKRVDGQLKGIAVSHVDDVLVARMKDMQLSDLLPKVLGTFQWKWSELPFTFRGRELSSDPRGFLVKMVNYATSLKPIKIPAARRKQLQEDLNEDEAKELLRVSGEIGWLGRQCRLDLAFLSGELQRARAAPCVADLVKANLAVSEAKRGAEVALVYPANLRLSSAVIGAAVYAGHANGPEHDDIERYKSCGGHVVLLTTDSILAGHQAPVAVLDWKSGMTQRVCRSTLAAEASHLADAVEAVDWAAVLFREAMNVSVDLLNRQGEVQRLPRFWATDAKSVYDHLTKEGSTKSKDKRMAIEGALLREVLRCENTHLRWIDDSQNIADVLTKLGVDKVYLYKVLREAKWSLVQDPAAAALKMRKSMQRASRKTAIDSRKTEKRQKDKLVRANEMRDIAD
ncbi:unnamed protein product [Prorocentrum cordatum]|uniref:Integrase catalytic domain-containing protein n=1 Tax=Prorocentrum cordatum TaxID=2364126 RepID=A0ABN9UPE5_9DINO|nr:unnamed protein product [Polarella glacialis]